VRTAEGLERDRATAEAFADPKPGDRFHEMYSWWVVVVAVDDDGIKTMSGSGPTNLTRGQFHDGEIVEPFPERAMVRWFSTAGAFRAAHRYSSGISGYSVMLADRGKIDVRGWLARAKALPDAPTDPKPAPDPARGAFDLFRSLRLAVAKLKPSDARRVIADVVAWLPERR